VVSTERHTASEEYISCAEFEAINRLEYTLERAKGLSHPAPVQHVNHSTVHLKSVFF